MFKSVNSSATCPCVRRLAGRPGSLRRAAFLQTAPRFPARSASSNVSPAQFNKAGMADLVQRRSRMPRMRSGGFLSSTIKETCPLPRDALRRPGPAHYNVELDKRKRLGEAATPANAALRARAPRKKDLPPDEAPFYCVSNAHDAARHARSFHLAGPEVAPFLQSAERFPPGPPFRAPAPNTYDPQKAYKKYFSGLLAGYTGTPTPVLYPDRSCDLNTVHPHCLLCPPLGLLTKQIGMPLHELYPCRGAGLAGFGDGGRRRSTLQAQPRAPTATGPERAIKLGVKAQGRVRPTDADIVELSGRVTDMGPGGFRSPGNAAEAPPATAAGGTRPTSRRAGRAARPAAEVVDNGEQQVAQAEPAAPDAAGPDVQAVEKAAVPPSPSATTRRSRSPTRVSSDRASMRRQRSPESAPVAVDGEEQGRRRGTLGSATLDPLAGLADADDVKDANRFRLSLACPVEGPRDSTWTAETAETPEQARFRLSLACPVEGPRDSTWTAEETPEQARFRLSLACQVEAPRDSALTAQDAAAETPEQARFRLSLACPVEGPRDSTWTAATTAVDEAVAAQGGDFRLSPAAPADAPPASLPPDGHPPEEEVDAAQPRTAGAGAQGSPSCRSSGNLAARAAAEAPGGAPQTRDVGAKTMSAPPSASSLGGGQRPQAGGGGAAGAAGAAGAPEQQAADAAEAWAAGMSGKGSPACRSSASIVAASKTAAADDGRRLSTKPETDLE